MNKDDNNSSNSKAGNITPTLFTWKSFHLKAPLSLIIELRALLVDYYYIPSIQPIAQNTVDNQDLYIE